MTPKRTSEPNPAFPAAPGSAVPVSVPALSALAFSSPKPKPRPKARRPADPAADWAKRLRAKRPDLVPFVLEAANEAYGRPAWERRLDQLDTYLLTMDDEIEPHRLQSRD